MSLLFFSTVQLYTTTTTTATSPKSIVKCAGVFFYLFSFSSSRFNCFFVVFLFVFFFSWTNSWRIEENWRGRESRVAVPIFDTLASGSADSTGGDRRHLARRGCPLSPARLGVWRAETPLAGDASDRGQLPEGAKVDALDDAWKKGERLLLKKTQPQSRLAHNRTYMT